MSAVHNKAEGGEKLIASNPSARQNYFLEEFVEAGIVLQGTEIKSIRSESPNLKDSFVEVTSKRRSGTTNAKKGGGSSGQGDLGTERPVGNGHPSKSSAARTKAAATKGKKKSLSKKDKKGSASAGSHYLEAWIVNLHIGPYSHGNIWNHEPRRRRKLLLHTHQIQKMFGSLTQDGKTIIPTRMYFTKGIVKIEVAIAKGKKKGDKRDDVKRRDQNREIDQAMKKSRRNER